MNSCHILLPVQFKQGIFPSRGEAKFNTVANIMTVVFSTISFVEGQRNNLGNLKAATYLIYDYMVWDTKLYAIDCIRN